MPTRDQLAAIKRLATSPEELAYFFDQLTSADWLPLLREDGLLGDPPDPIEQGDGIMFPFWPASRYMVRVAAAAPRAVSNDFWAVRQSRNPRVWWDTVDALVAMPAEYATRFIPFVKRWVHHPWRLGVDASAVKLVHHLIVEGARDDALSLARSLARLVPPDDWREGKPWLVLDEYQYGQDIPPIGRALAAMGPVGPWSLVEELEAFLAIRRFDSEGGSRADLSFIWRPAIEDHEQNWDFEREAKLVVGIRDGFEGVVRGSPEELSGVVTKLLESPWAVVRRLGLHLLVESGDADPDLVENVLTNRSLLAEDHHRHEFFRLLTERFSSLSPDARRRFVANARSVADATAASSAERWADEDAGAHRKFVIRRWLGAVEDHLEPAELAELEAARAATGEDPHPDFPAYHSSWRGSESPLSSEELRDRTPDEVVEYLATWEEPADFRRRPSAEGLAEQLTVVVAETPERFAPTTARYLDLKPAYFDGLINGLQRAIQNDRIFDWEPVLAACEIAIGKEDEEPTENRESTWQSTRMTVLRLVRLGLEGRPGDIPLSGRARAWSVIARLAEDLDPTPADEGRFGPPNMEPETYSLNTTRGAAFHALFYFLIWHHRHLGRPKIWSILERDAEASAVLDDHLDPERDPSISVRAAYGWWLPFLLDLDAGWVRDRADRIVGAATTELERAAWEGFLFRGRGTVTTHEIFAHAYAAYSEELASRETKPETSGRAGDPVQFFIDHVVLPWLWHPEMRDSLPLRTLLASGKGWLSAEVVEEAGRLIGRTEAKDITPELAAAYRDLWTFILEATADLEGDELRKTLAPFAWWFDSELSGEWTLPELLRLLANGIAPDPDFVVFRRLPSFAAEHPEETLRVIEGLAEDGDERWTLRVHEGEIRAVLEISIGSTDELLRARAIAIVHRLGRFGLGGLASLLAE